MGTVDMTTTRTTISTQALFARACIREMLQHKQTFYSPCMLALFSKVLGYLLIGTMTLSQIPQIVKILRKQSASGVSFLSILLMLEASTATVAYAIQKGFPVSTWGENIMLLIENVILVCLLLRYDDRLKTSMAFLIIYISFMLVLLWPTVPTILIWSLYLLSMPAIIASRVIQIYKIYRSKNPGQLSAFSSFLTIFHGFGRLTTSIISTGDDVMITTFIVVSVINILLFCQVIFYRQRLKKIS